MRVGRGIDRGGKQVSPRCPRGAAATTFLGCSDAIAETDPRLELRGRLVLLHFRRQFLRHICARDRCGVSHAVITSTSGSQGPRADRRWEKRRSRPPRSSLYSGSSSSAGHDTGYTARRFPAARTAEYQPGRVASYSCLGSFADAVIKSPNRV